MNCTGILIAFLAVAYVRADVQDDFKYLTSIFAGVFDNINQYNNDIKRGLPPQDRHLHLITSVAAEDVPVLHGRTSFYLEQYLNGNQSDLIRQRIYSFGLDAENRINLKLFSLVDQAKFAHAQTNSPLFKQLTMKDIVYASGCDVYWTRVSDDLFRSNMFNTCIVPIGGAEVLIIDKSTLSSTYLTADETWIFIKNGSVLKVYPSPYNMTKQISHQRPMIPASPSEVASTQLKGFQDILNALVQGQPVRYYLKTSDCTVSGGKGAGALPQMGGYIDTFEYFNDPAFGPVPYFGFSAFLPTRNASGGLFILLKEGLVYKTGDVKLRLTALSPDYQTVLNKQNLVCTIGSSGSSGSATFFSGERSVKQLTNFTSFVSILQNGGNVRFIANYGLCNMGIKAIGGGRIEDFEVSTDGNMVKSSQYKIITNYQGPGYVEDIVIGSFYSNSSAIFIASDVMVNTDNAVYVEEIDCEINGLRPGGGVYLFQLV
ncbi:uncharacterized protein [Haliotis cracherodii]|uniref:uncharacterized protein n=1 Tax=Haliotis cracherodii TaxID=6455 RepID=UPI0039EB8A60